MRCTLGEGRSCGDAVSAKAKAHAAEIGATPEVQRWVKRFRRLAGDMPLGVHVFVASGTVCVMALNDDGNPYETGGCGMDHDAVIADVHGGQWDGGDF